MRTTIHSVAADCIFAADTPFHRALGPMIDSGAPTLAVRDSKNGVLAGLDESVVRSAWQEQFDPERPIADLASRDLVAPNRDVAESMLGQREGCGAILVDAEGDLLRMERVVPVIRAAVVMAGGFGRRLRPLTDNQPKPLLDVGGEPLLGRILSLLAGHGVERVYLSVNYLADRIEQFVGDGSRWGLQAHYLAENEPLGTGAGLAQLDPLEEPFFLMNGDILTNVDLHAMARRHSLAGNYATVGTYRFAAPLPYGVVHSRDDRIESIEEKPVFRYPINAGLYVFDSVALADVERDAPLAMVDFLNDRASTRRVGQFAVVEYWNDVGSHEDYARAQAEVHDL